MESNDLAWSGQSWRLPLWLWLGLAAMAVGTLHILLDFGIGLFPLQGRLSPAVGATLLLVSLIHVWWSLSLAAGAQGNGGGVTNVAILGLGVDAADQRLLDHVLSAALPGRCAAE